MSELSPELKLLREQIINDITIIIDEKLLNYQKNNIKDDSSHSDLDSLESESSKEDNPQLIIDKIQTIFEKGFSKT
jgi:hypothetical protein